MARITPSASFLETARHLALLTELAYEPASVTAELLAGHYHRVEPLDDGDGFVAGNDGTVVVSFAGSRTLSHWQTNADCSLVTTTRGGRVHGGFLDHGRRILPQLGRLLPSFRRKGQPVVFTGHSRGGALAVLTPHLLEQLAGPAFVYTFGSPKVGDAAFAKSFGIVHFRFEHANDPVPKHPICAGVRKLFRREEHYVATGFGLTLTLTPASTFFVGLLATDNEPLHLMADYVEMLLRTERAGEAPALAAANGLMHRRLRASQAARPQSFLNALLHDKPWLTPWFTSYHLDSPASPAMLDLLCRTGQVPLALLEPAATPARLDAGAGVGPVLVVSPHGDGTHRSIREAVAAAIPEGEIRIRPGLYRERIEPFWPITLRGEGPAEQIVVEADGGVLSASDFARPTVQGLTLRSAGGPAVQSGTIRLIDCDVSGGVSLRLPADFLLQRCKIHETGGPGLLVDGGCKGAVLGCEVFGNGVGISLRQNSTAWIAACTIRDNRSCGVLVEGRGRVDVEHCLIRGNKGPGIHVSRDGSPLVLWCEIRANSGAAVRVDAGGAGTVERCDLRGNSAGAWSTEEWWPAIVRRDNLA